MGYKLPAKLQASIDQFTRWAEGYLTAEQNKNTIMETLYHYTDARGLEGIIKSGEIWFTDYRHLNDPSELVHGIAMARDVARIIANGADSQVRLLMETFKEMFKQTNFNATLEFYIASFSRARDDLNQWRAYADNGRGFAIGFSPRMFAITNELPTDKLPEYVAPVLYGVDEVRARHASALEKAVSILLNVNANRELVQDDAITATFMDRFVREIMAQPLIWNCLTSKHPAYRNEQEVRLLILGTPARTAPYVKTRTRRAETVPYIAHPLPLREPHNIAEIVVGPAAQADTERTVRDLLSSLGVDPNFPISRSDIPYRALSKQ